MSRKSARGKPGLPRDKSPDMRKEYLKYVARHDASSTADTDYFASVQGKDSTKSTPTLGYDVGDAGGRPGVSWRVRPLLPKWAAVATVSIAAVGLLAGGIWMVASMKSDITENRVKIDSIEASAKMNQDFVRREVDRLERLIEKSASEAKAFLETQTRRGGVRR